MTTRIECANCSDVVEVTASSVSLPFYCTLCVEDMFEDVSMEEVLKSTPEECDCNTCTGVEQFYEDMAPSTEQLRKDVQKFQGTTNVGPNLTICASEPGLVIEQDATNALLSDLEAQNTNLLNEITSLDNRIVELRKNAEITIDDLCYWRGRVMYWIGRVSKAEDRVSKAEDHPWKNLWAYLWK